jgi:hypothetical protein
MSQWVRFGRTGIQATLLVTAAVLALGQVGQDNGPAFAPAAALAAAATTAAQEFESYPEGTWAEGSTYGPWRVIYNGYGQVGIESDGTKVHFQRPQAAMSSGETHACLVVSTGSYGDLMVTLRAKTVRQLRQNSPPNPWETAWVLWHYSDNQHFYYFALKTNGWEIGKEDPAYPGSQRHLATGSAPTFSLGRWYQVRVQQVGATTSVWVDDQEVVSFTDTERPYVAGAVGLYTEDAHARFGDVTIASVLTATAR